VRETGVASSRFDLRSPIGPPNAEIARGDATYRGEDDEPSQDRAPKSRVRHRGRSRGRLLRCMEGSDESVASPSPPGEQRGVRRAVSSGSAAALTRSGCVGPGTRTVRHLYWTPFDARSTPVAAPLQRRRRAVDIRARLEEGPSQGP
jgi:hypothetical protein